MGELPYIHRSDIIIFSQLFFSLSQSAPRCCSLNTTEMLSFCFLYKPTHFVPEQIESFWKQPRWVIMMFFIIYFCATPMFICVYVGQEMFSWEGKIKGKTPERHKVVKNVLPVNWSFSLVVESPALDWYIGTRLISILLRFVLCLVVNIFYYSFVIAFFHPQLLLHTGPAEERTLCELVSCNFIYLFIFLFQYFLCLGTCTVSCLWDIVCDNGLCK